MTTRRTPGTLGAKVPFALNGTARSDLFVPRNTDQVVRFVTGADQAGTVEVIGLDQQGAEYSLSGAPVVVAAAPDKDQQVFDLPLGAALVQYVNTSGVAGHANFEVRVSRT